MSTTFRHLRQAPPSAPRRAFRADIQMLRAVAVSAVVLNHLWPAVFRGGYIGVDVFFVISGFLITTHLLKEIDGTGRLRFGAFYARRIRRLLPAAFLVLLAGGAASLLLLPFSRWPDTAQQILASTLYGENWLLAAKSVDYSAHTDSATIAQHYWSLSVEEQFYLVWPLLLLGLWLLAARIRRSTHRVVTVGLLVVAAASYAACIVATATDPNPAYFVTYGRAWEFAAGGLIALAALRRPRLLPPAPAKVLGAAGFLGILLCGWFFTADTAFPGWIAALPVLATAAVIVAGNGGNPPFARPLTASRPVQFLGDVSYSLYLWHWPLIVLAPFALGRPIGTPDKVVLGVLALALAALSKKFIEDPGQRMTWLRSSSPRTFLAMACAMAVMACGTALQIHWAGVKEDQAIALAAQQAQSPCYGPRSLVPGAHCPGWDGPSLQPVMTKDNQYWLSPPECRPAHQELSARGKRTSQLCDFSQGTSRARHVWLVGDSHAQQWQSAVYDVARRERWVLTTSMLGGCPAGDVSFTGFEGDRSQNTRDSCRVWASAVSRALTTDRPSLVITSAFARHISVDDGSGRPQEEQLAAGLGRSWRGWAANGSTVAVLADPPLNGAVRSPDCVTLKSDNPAACAVAQRIAQPKDPLAAGVRAAASPRVRLVDLTPYFCRQEKCYAVIGGVNVYFDANHLNRRYAELLGPELGRLIPR
ncbi:acyltransferase family protein [Arthrobacter woluwensis]|nr:acyltransferase family protein [Arthrobacter woluwensis]